VQPPRNHQPRPIRPCRSSIRRRRLSQFHQKATRVPLTKQRQRLSSSRRGQVSRFCCAAGAPLTHRKRPSVPATHLHATPYSHWPPRFGTLRISVLGETNLRTEDSPCFTWKVSKASAELPWRWRELWMRVCEVPIEDLARPCQGHVFGEPLPAEGAANANALPSRPIAGIRVCVPRPRGH